MHLQNHASAATGWPGSARRTRSYDAVLLKLLGATRGQVLIVQAMEYALLATLLSALALAIGSAAGWYVTTPRFNGDSKTLKVEHLYHLTAARPELARFVALPPGYRFDTTSGEDVWFDAEVAAEAP